MKITLIARSDNSGLGNQCEAIARMIRPDKVVLINFERFNGGRRSHPERYKSFYTITIDGFTRPTDYSKILYDTTHLISCEIFYGYPLVAEARRRGVKTILQPNYEFFDYLNTPYLPYPDALFLPSLWHVEDLARFVGEKSKIFFNPPPTFEADYAAVREVNFGRDASRKRRFLHPVGWAAIHDRNGTELLLRALKFSKADFELVICSQKPLTMPVNDPRITVINHELPTPQDIYRDFDAVILPRKFGGQSLPMNEALMSGLPVVMTNIDPNNRILPSKWLVGAKKTGSFMTRTMIDIFDADRYSLADRIDWFATIPQESLDKEKAEAYYIGREHFSPEKLRESWLRDLESL